MKINWKIRFQNKTWVVALFAALFFVLQSILAVFGLHWDYTNLLERFVTLISAVFALMGLVIDPTTAGPGDSQQALGYQVPKKEVK
ncbi:phage holin [Listeria ilorinensis]|uniref:phage holin n=1 Tax=Listeria ilorinensis TaxID=2867439 RepID=UPI001EF62496|nr:phage holin [Listeria ilorinensis]